MAHTDDNPNARATLLRMGIGDFNATMCIPVMFMGPAQTDPTITPVMILVKSMKTIMREMGAQVPMNHRMDMPFAHCLHALAGPHWAEHPWFDLCEKLLDAREHGMRFSSRAAPAPGGNPIELSGLGMLPSFDAIPGGIVTVGAAAYLLYRHFKKKRR